MKTKSLAIILLVLLLTACNISDTLSTRSDAVVSTAVEIADFDLPTGYQPDFSSDVMGYSVVAYHRGDGPSHLYLIQSDDKADGEKLAQALDEIVVGSGNTQARQTVIETRTVSVNGQETTLVISDALNSEGLSYRQAVVPFQGKGGPALLVFSEPHESWDPAILNALIASIQ
jgi:hypothetical protein